MNPNELPTSIQHIQSELERMNRLYAMLSHINRAIIRIADPQELYLAACQIANVYGGFTLAWIGLLAPDGETVVPVAAAGIANAEQLKQSADRVGGFGPTMQATSAGHPVVINDMLTDPNIEPWRGLTEKWGFRSGAAFPIRLDGQIIGAFGVASAEPDIFRDAEVRLLTEVTDDLCFAIDRMRRDEKHSAAESKLRYLAYYDSQTGMPSRTLFEEKLSKACHDNPSTTVAVLVAELRRYHALVQLLGPDAGLKIIRAVAIRLETALPSVSAARISESTFAIIFPAPAGLDVVEELAWSIHQTLSARVEVEGQDCFLDAFVGIAIFPKDGQPIDVLTHAMQAAAVQSHDKGSYCRFFDAKFDDGSRYRLDLDAALHRALERNEFTLHYQPQMDMSSGCLVGAEALIRWQRPGVGLISPQEFIPLLEENGLIGAVGEWALHEACRQNKQWQEHGLPPFRISVNLSARQFLESDIRETVRRVLDETGLEPRWLELELTESIVLLDADSVIRAMKDLNTLGITHALDDFGTGYSSLSYLQRLPVARIKLDKSFVTNITSNPGDAAIARAVVGMAHSLHLSVIAEGVETEGQLEFLRGLGCEEIQGYYFSRPLPVDEFAVILREERSIPPAKTRKTDEVLLLVDDDPNVLSALNRVLRQKGYHVVSTTSAREGFNLMATHHPGVVICDQRMMEMTGTEFLRRVKELHPEIVRIVLSGYTELRSVIDAVNQGAVFKFLTKPCEDEHLIEVVKDAFRIFGLYHENRELTRQLKTIPAQIPVGE